MFELNKKTVALVAILISIIPSTSLKAEAPPEIEAAIRFNRLSNLPNTKHTLEYKGWGVWLTPESKKNVKALWEHVTKQSNPSDSYDSLVKTVVENAATNLKQAYNFIPPETKQDIVESCVSKNGAMWSDDYAQCVGIVLISDIATVGEALQELGDAKFNGVDYETAMKTIADLIGDDSPLFLKITDQCGKKANWDCTQKALAEVYATLDASLGGMSDALGSFAWLEEMETHCINKSKEVKAATREQYVAAAKACESPAKRYADKYISSTPLGAGVSSPAVKFVGYKPVKEGKLKRNKEAEKTGTAAKKIARKKKPKKEKLASDSRAVPDGTEVGMGAKGLGQHAGSGGKGANESVSSKGSGKGTGDGTGDLAGDRKKPRGSADIDAEKALKKSEAQKAIAKLKISSGIDGKPISTQELTELLYKAYDGGAMRGSGAGERPECPEFIKEAGFCGSGSVYDYRYYKLTSSGDGKLQSTTKSMLNNIPGVNIGREYPNASRIPSVNTELGSTNLANLYRGVYRATKNQLEDELLSFMAELWIEKYLETAYTLEPENAAALEDKLMQETQGLSCIGDELRQKLKNKVTKLGRNANQLAEILSPDGQSTSEKKKKYKANLANAAQCVNVLYEEVMTLRDKFGLNDEAVKTLSQLSAEGNLAEQVGYAGMQMMSNLMLGPAGTLLNYMMDNFPVGGSMSGFATAECSLVNERLSPYYTDKRDGRVWDSATEKIPQDVIENSMVVSRIPACREANAKLQGLSEELSSLFAAYPILGANQGDKGIENAGFKKIVGVGKNSGPAEQWRRGAKSGPCMAGYLNNPKDVTSGPKTPDPDSSLAVNKLLETKPKKMLDSISKEMRKLCSDKAGAITQIVSDPNLSSRFFSCETDRFLGLVNYHNEEPAPVKTVGKSSTAYLKELQDRFEQSNAKYGKLAKLTHERLSQDECDARKDTGPLVCFMWKDQEMAKRVAEGKAKVMELGFMAVDAMGSMSPDAFISRGWKQTAVGMGSGFVVGGGMGLGLAKLMDDGGAGARQLESKIAQFQAGLNSDIIELDRNIAELEKLSGNSGSSHAFIQGGATGALGSNLATGGANIKWGSRKTPKGSAGRLASIANKYFDGFNGHKYDVERAAVNAIGMSEDLGNLSKSLGLANQTFDEARAAAAHSGDDAMIDALNRQEAALEKIVSGAPPDAQKYIKGKKLGEIADLLKVYGYDALAQGDTFGKAVKAANPAEFRKAMKERIGNRAANAMTDEEIAAASGPSRADIRRRAAEAADARANTEWHERNPGYYKDLTDEATPEGELIAHRGGEPSTEGHPYRPGAPSSVDEAQTPKLSPEAEKRRIDIESAIVDGDTKKLKRALKEAGFLDRELNKLSKNELFKAAQDLITTPSAKDLTPDVEQSVAQILNTVDFDSVDRVLKRAEPPRGNKKQTPRKLSKAELAEIEPELAKIREAARATGMPEKQVKKLKPQELADMARELRNSSSGSDLDKVLRVTPSKKSSTVAAQNKVDSSRKTQATTDDDGVGKGGTRFGDHSPGQVRDILKKTFATRLGKDVDAVIDSFDDAYLRGVRPEHSNLAGEIAARIRLKKKYPNADAVGIRQARELEIAKMVVARKTPPPIPQFKRPHFDSDTIVDTIRDIETNPIVSYGDAAKVAYEDGPSRRISGQMANQPTFAFRDDSGRRVYGVLGKVTDDGDIPLIFSDLDTGQTKVKNLIPEDFDEGRVSRPDFGRIRAIATKDYGVDPKSLNDQDLLALNDIDAILDKIERRKGPKAVEAERAAVRRTLKDNADEVAKGNKKPKTKDVDGDGIPDC